MPAATRSPSKGLRKAGRKRAKSSQKAAAEGKADTSAGGGLEAATQRRKATPTKQFIQDNTLGVCKFYDGSKPLKLYQKPPPSLSDILSPTILQDQKNRLLKTLSGLSKDGLRGKNSSAVGLDSIRFTGSIHRLFAQFVYAVGSGFS